MTVPLELRRNWLEANGSQPTNPVPEPSDWPQQAPQSSASSSGILPPRLETENESDIQDEGPITTRAARRTQERSRAWLWLAAAALTLTVTVLTLILIPPQSLESQDTPNDPNALPQQRELASPKADLVSPSQPQQVAPTEPHDKANEPAGAPSAEPIVTPTDSDASPAVVVATPQTKSAIGKSEANASPSKATPQGSKRAKAGLDTKTPFAIDP